MEKEEISNIVSQSNNIVENGDIAGRDINKNTFNQNGNIVNIYLAGSQDYKSLVQVLQKITDLPEEFVSALIVRGENEKYGIEILEKSLSLLSISKRSLVSVLFNDIKEEYESILLGKINYNLDEEYLKGIAKAAAVSMRRLEFGKAHQLFVNALSEIKSNSSSYNLVYREYLITGFIHHSRRNDMAGLKSLLRKKRPITTENDLSTDYVIANIFQEICSRDTNLESLKKATTILEKIYKDTPLAVKPLMANSLGLAYRRVGERTNVEYLERAVEIFKEGLQLNKENATLDVQLKDHMAITLVRIFEFTQEEEYLNKAEQFLIECLETLKIINDPRDFMLKPRVLNNIGNVFKQRVLIFNDIKSASKAISYYDEAGKIWTEKDAAYEWGILKKNIGETKCALGNITDDPELLLQAIQSCISAMKYRDLKNSPYQWAKSVEIIFIACIFLQEKNKINIVNRAIKNKIFGFAKAVATHPTQWSSNNFPHFEENSRKILEYLHT